MACTPLCYGLNKATEIAALATFVITVLLTSVVMFAAHWYLFEKSPKPSKEARLPRHMAMAGIALIGLFAVVLALPVSDEIELQILGILGIVLSGGVAIASNQYIG